MFKKKQELEITIDKYEIDTWKLLEKIIKDGWEIKDIKNYTSFFTHITLKK